MSVTSDFEKFLVREIQVKFPDLKVILLRMGIDQIRDETVISLRYLNEDNQIKELTSRTWRSEGGSDHMAVVHDDTMREISKTTRKTGMIKMTNPCVEVKPPAPKVKEVISNSRWGTW